MAYVIDETGPHIWSNTNIWVSDPSEPPDSIVAVPDPIPVNQDYLMKARVHRTNAAPTVADPHIHFYWAVPTTMMTPSNSHPVGPAIGLSQPVNSERIRSSSSAYPFQPYWINNGHICMLVAITEGSTPPPVFDPNLDNIAQRNLHLLNVPSGGMFWMAFEMASPDPEPDEFVLQMEPGKPEEFKQVVEGFARDLPLLSLEGEIKQFGVTGYDPCINERSLEKMRPVLERVELKPRERRGLTLAGRLEGDAAIFNVVQGRRNGKVDGGLTVIVYAKR